MLTLPEGFSSSGDAVSTAWILYRPLPAAKRYKKGKEHRKVGPNIGNVVGKAESDENEYEARATRTNGGARRRLSCLPPHSRREVGGNLASNRATYKRSETWQNAFAQ